MVKAFYDLTFTDQVREMQRQMGSERLYFRDMAPAAPAANTLGPDEKRFIQMRDGFYQATNSASGWPYVQFRGGPRGFLKVLDDQTIGYADYRGNRQYISDGNLKSDDRVAMILVDYPNSARLKILARAAIVEDEDVTASVMDATYRAHPERAIIMKVEAFDWNCPKHLPVRLTMEEMEPILTPFQNELAALRAENEALKKRLGDQS